MALLNDRRQTMRGQSRRRAPRWWINRNAQIYLGQSLTPADSSKQPLILMGYTYDLSATGLSVYLPALDCDIQDLLNENGQVEVVLSTTPRQVKVKATPVRCETIVPALQDKSACIGMRIDQHDNNYQKYIEYLREFQ
jgi:hypothetical protein